MSYATEAASHTARKVQRCTWCWQCINPGEQYKRYRYFNDGDVGTVKAHPECYEAIQEYAAQQHAPNAVKPQLIEEQDTEGVWWCCVTTADDCWEQQTWRRCMNQQD